MSSLCVPCSRIFPSRTARITSAPMMVESRWAITKEVLPRITAAIAS